MVTPRKSSTLMYRCNEIFNQNFKTIWDWQTSHWNQLTRSSVQLPDWLHLPTHDCGTLTTDIFLGSLDIVSAITSTAILPLDSLSLYTVTLKLWSSTLIVKSCLAIVNHYCPSSNSAESTEMCSLLFTNVAGKLPKAYDSADLPMQIAELENLKKLNDKAHTKLDKIDKAIACILVHADQTCQNNHTYPWSPTLHHAYLIHQYWALTVSTIQTKNHINQISNSYYTASLDQIHIKYSQMKYPALNFANIDKTCSKLNAMPTINDSSSWAVYLM